MTVTKITTLGQQAIAQAIANQTTVKIARMAVGDGNGGSYIPTIDQTALKNEKWSGNLDKVAINPANPNQVICESIIAPGVGGFYIREVGLFDENDTLIAISDFPESYKATADQYELFIRMVLEVDSTDAIINMSKDVIYATKSYVDAKTNTSDLQNELETHIADASHIHWLGTVTGTNTLVSTYNKISSYFEGLAVSFKNSTLATNVVSLNINNLGAIPILTSEGEAFSEAKENSVYTVRYSNGNFILQGSQGVSKSAQVSSLQITSNTAGTLSFKWTNPSDKKYKGVIIVAKANSLPTSPTDGKVIYNSNDATPATTASYTGLEYKTLYYLRAFAYTYKNATKIYTDIIEGAVIEVITAEPKGTQTFTASGTFTVPSKVTSIDVFLVGGGGPGTRGSKTYSSYGAGGGSGYTTTVKSIPVTPGDTIPVIVGAGGVAVSNSSTIVNGGESSFGNYAKALGGSSSSSFSDVGGPGGSGGGGLMCGPGGSNGSNGQSGTSKTISNLSGGPGQGETTRAFGESSGTLYAGGGGAAGGYAGEVSTGGGGGGGAGLWYNSAGNAIVSVAGTPNTGGGGGGGTLSGGGWGANGGSGIVIVRWGY